MVATKTIWICKNKDCETIWICKNKDCEQHYIDFPSTKLCICCGSELFEWRGVSLDEHNKLKAEFSSFKERIRKELDKRISVWQEIYEQADTKDIKEGCEAIISVLTEVERFFAPKTEEVTK